MNKKCKKSEGKYAMERCLQKEPVEYGVLMPSPELNQQAASSGANTMPFKCFHRVVLL